MTEDWILGKVTPLEISDDLALELNRHKSTTTVIIMGQSGSSFDGRIKSDVNPTDHTLIVKRDGTILLHSAEGSKPVHWQLAKAGSIEFKFDEEKRLLLETYRPKTKETLIITFEEVYAALVFHATASRAGTDVLGTEADFRSFLITNPERIENGLRILSWEQETPYGFVDIMAEDSAGCRVIIEIKRGQAVLKDAQQLERYKEHYIRLDVGKRLRPILVAPAIPQKVFNYLRDHEMEGIEIPWQEVFPTMTIPQKTSLEEFFDSDNESNE